MLEFVSIREDYYGRRGWKIFYVRHPFSNRTEIRMALTGQIVMINGMARTICGFDWQPTHDKTDKIIGLCVKEPK